MMAGTSAVYQLIVQILTLTSSLLIYSVRGTIKYSQLYLVHNFYCIGFTQIPSFTVSDLPSDMTVFPQEYKLNCTKIGHGSYSISMSIGNTTLANYINCIDQLSYSPCPGTVLVSSTNTVRYIVTLIWDGMTVTSESNSRSTTGDQMYQCVVQVTNQPPRIQSVTLTGNAL